MDQITNVISSFTNTLYNTLSSDSIDTSNIVLSPASVIAVIAILFNASNNSTKQELGTLLKYEVEDLNNDMSLLLTNLKIVNWGEEKINEFKFSNFVFYRNNLTISNNFKLNCEEVYDTIIEPYCDDESETVNKINKYVSDATNNMIPSIIKEVDQNLAVLIINTIYFQGAWLKKFDIRDTKNADFKGVDGRISKVPMMTQFNDFLVYDHENFKAIKMNYVSSDYSFIAIQPKDDNKLDNIRKDIFNDNGITRMINKMNLYNVKLTIPRFKIRSSFDLDGPLKKMGYTELFGSPDFSNMIVDGNFMSPCMKQIAVIDVDEEGTKAAAISQADVPDGGPSGLKFIEMNFNKPFLYCLVNNIIDPVLEIEDLYLPLFMGAYNQPDEN